MLLRYSDKKGYHEHIMITGLVKKTRGSKYSYKIYCYAHSSNRNGNSTDYNSLDEFFEATNKWNQSINIYYLA